MNRTSYIERELPSPQTRDAGARVFSAVSVGSAPLLHTAPGKHILSHSLVVVVVLIIVVLTI